jgi:23S rRNA (cytosine1962-C5)-methyltransferase
LRGNRSLSSKTEFYQREILDSTSSFRPGEWICIHDADHREKVFGFINPHIERGAMVKVVPAPPEEISDQDESELAKTCIRWHLEKAVKAREIFQSMGTNRRLFFGVKDGLPGLIVDEYCERIIVQINTAGLDRFRDYIKHVILEICPQKSLHFLDDPSYRAAEELPQYQNDDWDFDLEVMENGLKYLVPAENLQKIGYYYDHRINRLKLEQWARDLNFTPAKGVDLFCYMGSWGLHALRAGCHHMTFVDQGPFEKAVQHNMALNQLESGEFCRSDVFKWLDQAIAKQERYQIVICDPPAFSKNLKNKARALGGYEKLFQKMADIADSPSLLAIGSCTQGIQLDELDRHLSQAFRQKDKRLQMLDLGVQGPDHPFSHFSDPEFYIKFMLYLVT